MLHRTAHPKRQHNNNRAKSHSTKHTTTHGRSLPHKLKIATQSQHQHQQQQQTFSTTTTEDTTQGGPRPNWDARRKGDFGSIEYLKKPEQPAEYRVSHIDPPLNHTTHITPESLKQRARAKYTPSPYPKPLNPQHFETEWDAIIIGAGHNGLVCANYLANQDLKVLVLERRHIVGGAAVTEELYPGFKYSRASYLAGLFRQSIVEELNLEDYGFEYLIRNPSSFTPTLPESPYGGKSLLLGSDKKTTFDSIAQFSVRDAERYFEYEEFLGKCRDIISPFLELPLPGDRSAPLSRQWAFGKELFQQIKDNHNPLSPMYQLMTGSATQTLNRWFESDILKATLATDSVIGSALSPSAAGSGYVLLHHVMGEVAGQKGVWAYMRGGMGTITRALADRAVETGNVTIVTNTEVEHIITADLIGPPLPNQAEGVQHIREAEMKDMMKMGMFGIGGKPHGVVKGVMLSTNEILYAPIVISNTTPYHTFIELMSPELNVVDEKIGQQVHKHDHLPSSFLDQIRFTEYQSNCMKINLAVNKLPDFKCLPNKDTCAFNIELQSFEPSIQHRGTIHFEDKMEDLERAYLDTLLKRPATRPIIEMTIPSALDDTLAPPGCMLYNYLYSTHHTFYIPMWGHGVMNNLNNNMQIIF